MPPDTTPTDVNVPAPDISPETEAAYQSLAGPLAVTPPSKTKSLNLKVMATRGHLLHEQAHKDDAKELFPKLPLELFNRGHLSLLLTCARAASFVYGSQQTAKALQNTDDARLSKDLVQDAMGARAEMTSVVEYVLGKDPEVAEIIAHIRKGRGYEDLASDLDRLARLYVFYKDTLQQEGLRYKATDAAHARDLDARITASLDDSRRARIAHWVDQGARITTLLRTSYEEVALAGRWLLRATPNLDLRFPSLYAGKGGRKAKVAAPPAAALPLPPIA